MEPSYTSVVLVDHKFQALSDRFLVETTPNDLIYHLKKKMKEQWHGDADFADYDFTNLAKLVVWKTTDAIVINKSNSIRMAEILGAINDDRNTIRRLEEDESVADLGLSNFQTLLVQLPGTSRISTIVGCVLIQV